MSIEDLLQFIFPADSCGVVTASDQLAIFGEDRGKGFEGIEADDAPVVVEWLVYPAQRREQRHVLTPADAELQDHAMYRRDHLVQALHEVDTVKSLAG